MDIVRSLDEIEANLRKLEDYLSSADPDEREFARSLVRRGRCFVIAERHGRTVFGPSRFIGYRNNTREAHAANDDKDGKRTNPAISALLGRPQAGDAEMEGQYRLFCRWVDVPYRDLAGKSIRRWYWRMREASSPGRDDSRLHQNEGRLVEASMPKLSVDTSLYRSYSEARRQFLRTLGCDDSCRDPLSEFAERLVCQQLGGTLASSRVQKGYDLVTPDGRRVQVKYLANPSGTWRNGHAVVFSGEMDDYAVVFFEGLDVRAILVFRRETLARVCAALRKRHPDQDKVLQLGQADFNKIVGDLAAFEEYGVTCFLP